MKALFVLLLCLPLSLLCQNADSAGTTPVYGQGNLPLDFFAGPKVFTRPFYDQLNTTKHFDLFHPVNLVGIGYNGAFTMSRGYGYYGHVALLFVLPQQLHIKGRTADLSGFVVSCSLAGVDLLPQDDKTDLIFSMGFNTGRLRTYHNDSLRQKNPFFSPMVAFLPKIVFKRFEAGLNLQYEYDISSPNWRRTYFSKKEQVSIDRFKQTGYTVMFFIGLLL